MPAEARCAYPRPRPVPIHPGGVAIRGAAVAVRGTSEPCRFNSEYRSGQRGDMISVVVD